MIVGALERTSSSAYGMLNLFLAAEFSGRLFRENPASDNDKLLPALISADIPCQRPRPSGAAFPVFFSVFRVVSSSEQ